MPPNEREALLAYVTDLAKATLEGRVGWSVANPTTFVWLADTGRLILQRLEHAVPGPPKVESGRPIQQLRKEAYYVLSAYANSNPNAAEVVIDGSMDSDINKKLAAIDDFVVNLASEKKLAFLKTLLPK